MHHRGVKRKFYLIHVVCTFVGKKDIWRLFLGNLVAKQRYSVSRLATKLSVRTVWQHRVSTMSEDANYLEYIHFIRRFER
jgi:hypothetical protein